MTTTASSPTPVSAGKAPAGPPGGARQVALPSTYFRAIDGLRGLAVISVVLFHTGLYSNGLFGVDIFMVISGFLITLTLLRERSRTGRISLTGFYRRRAKRLLVPLLVTLGATLLLVLRYGRGDDLDVFVRQSIASVLNVANWEQNTRGSSYWDQMAGVHAPLGHMWSLSLTEQFYLLWPPLLVVVALVAGARNRLAVGLTAAVLVIAMTVTTAVLYDGTNANLLYLATFSHGASLLVGALAALPVLASAHRRALGTPPRTKLPRGVVGIAGIALLAGIVTLSVRTASYEAPWLYAWGGLTIVAALCGALLLTLTVEGTWIARVLSVAPLVGVGKFSYTLFLVHLPVLWGLQMALPDPRPLYLALIGLPLSIVLASFLHHIVGEPVRIRRWNRTGAVAFALLLAAVVGGTAAAPAFVHQARSHGGQSVLILGDSLGHDFADALTFHAAGMFTVTDGAFDGCGIFDQETSRSAESDVDQDPGAGCFPWQERWAGHVKVADPDVVVVTLGWDAVQQRRDGHWMDACSPEYREHYARQLEQMHTVLTEGDEQRQLLLTTTRPFTNLVDPSWARCQTDQLRQLAATHDNVEVLELAAHVCTESECQQQTPEGNALYLDTVHFTPTGIGWLAPWLADELTRATTPAST